MATITAGVTISSTDLNNDSAGASSESLSVSLSDALTVLGNHHSYVFATSTTSAVFLTHGNYSKSYVLLYNTSTTTAETIQIELADGDNDVMILGAGEFAFFPWSATHSLYADAASGTPILEVRLYQSAA